MATTKRSVRGNAAEHVHGDLRDAILSGQFAKGSRLPTEKQLAESYGVSGPTVREAIRGLTTARLIEVRHGSGAYVTADSDQTPGGVPQLVDSGGTHRSHRNSGSARCASRLCRRARGSNGMYGTLHAGNLVVAGRCCRALGGISVKRTEHSQNFGGSDAFHPNQRVEGHRQELVRIGGDVGAAAVANFDQPRGGQSPDRLANSRSADAVALCQLLFSGEP